MNPFVALNHGRFAFEESRSPHLDKAFAPQRRWHAKASRSARKQSNASARSPTLLWVALFVAQRAVERLAQPSLDGIPAAHVERSRGHRKLRLLFALGEAHAALISSSEQLQEQEPALVLTLVAACLDEHHPVLVQDASARLLATLLAMAPDSTVSSGATVSGVAQEASKRLLGPIARLQGASGQCVWFQEALLLCLSRLDTAAFVRRMNDLFGSPRADESLFLRARLLKCLPAWETPALQVLASKLLMQARQDPSEVVRLETVAAAVRRHDLDALMFFASGDASARVRSHVAYVLDQAFRHARDTAESQFTLGALLACAVPLLEVDAPADCRLHAMSALCGVARHALLEGHLLARATLREALVDNSGDASKSNALRSRLDALPLASDFRGALAREWHVFHVAAWCLAQESRADAMRALAAFALRIPSGSARRLPRTSGGSPLRHRGG